MISGFLSILISAVTLEEYILGTQIFIRKKVNIEEEEQIRGLILTNSKTCYKIIVIKIMCINRRIDKSINRTEDKF